MTPKKNKSVYAPAPKQEKSESHTLAILVKNEPGILARIVGLFTGRGYNIDSLTVTEVDHVRHLARITLACSGKPHVIEQIIHQLERLVQVRVVNDLTMHGNCIFRELALVRVKGCTLDEVEETNILHDFDVHILDTTEDFSIFEVSGTSEDIENFLEAIKPLGIINVTRTGIIGIARTKKSLEDKL